MDPFDAIEINNVSKSFRLVTQDVSKKNSLVSKSSSKVISKTIIDNISINIRKGEVLGILGRNGSGKSTLLSLIAHIMEPDSGQIYHSGKIASILELGMGFHTDMSGRDNIYLKGELYGFSRKEMEKRMNTIIDYSGLFEYIDNPVRTYSSGMIARLAFSIMVNVDSDIMLVDEVLSVGDSAFSFKAQQHFKKLSKSGKTIIIVSHNIKLLEELCTRAIWIEKGKIVKDGPAKKICSEYQNYINESPDIITDLANYGVPDSQYKLAIMYRDGTHGHIKDINQFEQWVEKAANQGHTRAQVEFANILYERGDKSLAEEYYRYAANKGDTEAKSKIALFSVPDLNDLQILLDLYMQLLEKDNNPVNKYRYADLLLKVASNFSDKQKAFNLFLESADSGYPNSMHQVALLYKEGIGVSRDLSKMECYLIKAADCGFIPSMILLADIYSQGKLIPQDDCKSFSYVKQAAELGNINFMYRLANLYSEGIGVERNVPLSNEWFSKYYIASLFQYKNWIIPYVKSGFIGNPTIYSKLLDSMSINFSSGYILENMYNRVLNNISVNEQLDQLKKLSAANNIDALRKLGNCYYDGIGVPRDYNKSLEAYTKASDLGDSWSMNRLGEMYRDGKGTHPDLSKSIHYFENASIQGNVLAMFNLITLINAGTISVKSLNYPVIDCLKMVASLGNIDAIRKIGNIYYDGFGCVRDYTEALTWYKKSALLGDVWSKNRIAEMYRDGKGIPIDYNEALKWFIL